MKARLLIASVATVGLTILACKDQTPQFAGPGAVPGAPVTMTLNATTFSMPDGGKATLAAQLLDSAGNVATGTITFASCNSAVVTTTDSSAAPANWAAATTLSAVGVSPAPANLVSTPTCVTATSGSLVDSAFVTVGPASLSISGPVVLSSGLGATCVPFGSCPAYFGTFGDPAKGGDTVSQRVSGGLTSLPHYVYKVTGYTKGGTALAAGSFFHQWGSVDSTLLRPWSRSADSVIATQPGHLGNPRLTVTAVGGATAVLNVAVVPDTFTKTGGTVTILGTNVPGLDSVRLTRCPAGGAAPCIATAANPGFGTRVFVDGVETFILGSSTATNQFVMMPSITHTGAQVVVREGNMGTLNGAAATWEEGLTVGAMGPASTNTKDPSDPTNDDPLTTPMATTKNATSTTTVYGILSGTACPVDATVSGDPATDCLDWLSFTNSDAVNTRSLTVNLAWLTDADLDLAIFNSTGTTQLAPAAPIRGLGATAGAANLESFTLNIGPATTLKVRVRYHTPGTAPATVYRLQWVLS